MSGMRDGWFIADADGYAVGPLSRAELVAQHQRGAHGTEAMAWHVELAEWRPLERIAAATAPEQRAPQTTAAERAEARAEARVVRDRAEKARAAEPRPERQKGQQKQQKLKAGEAVRPQAAPNPVDQAVLKRLPPAMQAEALKRMSPAVRAEAEKALKGGASPEAAARAATALRRFFARVLDTFTLGMLAASAAWAFVLDEPAATAGIAAPTTFLLYFVAIAALLPVEALALSMFGTTPGKALLGLTVRRNDGQRVALGTALQRAWKVTWRGIALGVPVIAFITSIVAFTRYSNTGRSSWDADAGTDVRAQPIESWRWQAAAFAAFLAFLGMSSGFWPGLVEQLQALR